MDTSRVLAKLDVGPVCAEAHRVPDGLSCCQFGSTTDAQLCNGAYGNEQHRPVACCRHVLDPLDVLAGLTLAK